MTAFRLAGAGLAAGAANMILGVTFASVLGVEKFQALLRAHDLRAIGEPGDAIPHTIVRLLLGLGVTLLYWAVLPRVGSTVGAALVAAVFGWAFVKIERD